MKKVAVSLFAVLLLLGARAHPLWGDEAETALFARNILTYGVPKGWDGVNIMGINNAVVLNDDLINHTSPWAQYYVTAASFALFGQSSFTARIPSLVFSIVTVLLLYSLTLRLTGSKRTSMIAVTLASLSVPFLLFSYQARYYSLVTFAALGMAYLGLTLHEAKRWGIVAFIALGIAFFYGNYVVFSAYYVSLGVALLFRGRRFMSRYVLCAVVIAGFTLPWIVTFRPFDSQGAISIPTVTQLLYYTAAFFGIGAYPYHANGVFPASLLALFFLTGVWKKQAFAMVLSVVFLGIMAFFTAIGDVVTSFVHMRYTALLLPFLFITSAMVIDRVVQWKKIAGAALLIVYLATNLLTFTKPRSYILEYLGEMLRPYQTPDSVVSDYLQTNAKAGDTAFVSLDRNHEPLIFHLQEKIRFVNRVSLVNTRIFPKNRGIIPRYIYDFRDSPDWVILYSKRGDDGTFATFDYRPVPPEINLSRDYEEVVLPIFFSDMSRPEIELHSFREITPDYRDQVFIYRKKK